MQYCIVLYKEKTIQEQNLILSEQQDEIENLRFRLSEMETVNAEQSEIIIEKQNTVTQAQTDLEALKQVSVKYIGRFKITYYCSCKQCTGSGTGITASGVKATDGVTVAADTSILPFGTKLYIQGIGERMVQDRGGAIKGNKIDVYVSNHNQIPSVGTHYSDVWLVIK